MRPESVRSALTLLPRTLSRHGRRSWQGLQGLAATRSRLPTSSRLSGAGAVTGVAVGLSTGLSLGVVVVGNTMSSHDHEHRPAPGGPPRQEADLSAREQLRDAERATRSRNLVADAAGGHQASNVELPSSVTSLDWGRLAECESGGDPDEVSTEGYAGLFQFDERTWQAVGGEGEPQHASVAEQRYRAQLLYRRDGTAPWPSCGHLL